MSKLQCVVTSYKRLKYLKPCLESMRLDDIELYVVDGGSDLDVVFYLAKAKMDGIVADYHLMHDNPGADVLKNEGIKRFCTNREFVVSSDDFLFHRGWSDKLYHQYRTLNSHGLRYTMVACPTELVIERHGFEGGKYKEIHGIPFMSTTDCMVAGTMMDRSITEKVGLFPVFGKGGHGDVAISRRMGKLGMKVGYLRTPIIWHLGHEKDLDYAEYSAAFEQDNEQFLNEAKRDVWTP